MLEGEFPSYFAGKPLPVKEVDEKKSDNDDNDSEQKTTEKPNGIDLSKIERSGQVLSKGKPGKIFIIGTSDVLKNSVISPDGTNINSIFIMNLIDYLNDREGIAVMRGKTGNLNPLSIKSASSKSGIKYFNIIGLPVIVVLFGLIIWFIRHRRKLTIQEMFKK